MTKSVKEKSLIRNMVSEGMSSKLGGGDRFRIWFDMWCAPLLLQSLFLGLYVLSLQKDYSVMHMGHRLNGRCVWCFV